MTQPQRDKISRPGIRVGRIRYMNVAPVYHGLANGGRPPGMSLVSGPPATLNAMLAEGKLDISPVSSAAYARHADRWLLLPDLSISCRGPVMSVLLASRRPLSELGGRTVMLTRESATAAALTRLLLAEEGIRPRFVTGRVCSRTDLGDDVGAALVIGDAALREPWAETFPHVLDLGTCWWERTGLPFVFALWAVRRRFAEAHPERVRAAIRAFRESRRYGEGRMDEIIPEASRRLGIGPDTCRRYYDRLHFGLDADHIRGVRRFFGGLHREGILPRPVEMAFFGCDSCDFHTDGPAFFDCNFCDSCDSDADGPAFLDCGFCDSCDSDADGPAFFSEDRIATPAPFSDAPAMPVPAHAPISSGMPA
jgi:chorismate dehydratase